MEWLAIWARDVLINGVVTSGAVPSVVRVWFYRLLGMRLERGALIMPRTFVGGRLLTMREGAGIYYDCHIDTSAPVTIGRNVCVSTGVTLVTAGHDIGPVDMRMGPDKAAPIVIGDGCWIGIGATVLGGVTVGEGCVIAAGAMVARDCAPNGLYAGSPVARRIRDLEVDLPRRHGPRHGVWTRDTRGSSQAQP